MVKKVARKADLLKLFTDRTGGRATIAPFREPTAYQIAGFERSRVRRIAYIPRDLL